MENKKTEYNIWPLLLFKNCECGATGCNKKVPKEDNLKLQIVLFENLCQKSTTQFKELCSLLYTSAVYWWVNSSVTNVTDEKCK